MNDESIPLMLFISYSHKDKDDLEQLTTHLATAKRNGIIKAWTDRELVAGDKLAPEIRKNLEKANLIAFLVSPDFLNSGYCYDVEFLETLARLPSKECRIIPIIVRDCDWKDSEIAEYLVAPKDGKPVSQFENKDEAWLNVVEAIKSAAKRFLEDEKKESTIVKITPDKNFELKPEFIEELNSTGVSFQHKVKEQVILDDIFVFPSLKNLKRDFDSSKKIISSEDLVNLDDSKNKILIVSDDQGGKTSLARQLFQRYHSDGHIPLVCSAENIKSANIKDIIAKIVEQRYSDLDSKGYDQQNRKKILIIDDFENIKLNSRYQNNFIEQATAYFDLLILTSHSSIMLAEPTYGMFSDFSQFEIMAFGNLLRSELAEKWLSMGEEQTKDVALLHKETDEMVRHIDSLIIGGALPPIPIAVLSIIQMLDTATPTDYSLTSYGHCYQSIIQAQLNRVNIKTSNFDSYMNYCSELAYFIFRSGKHLVNEDQLIEFKAHYSEVFELPSHDVTIQTLIEAKILEIRGDDMMFKHRYIFYFYVAKYISDNLSAICKQDVERLCENLHTTKNANILIFLVHHSRETGVTDEIFLNATTVFEQTKEATLINEDTKCLLEFIESIPKLEIEENNVDSARKKRLKNLDSIEVTINNSKDKEGEPDDIKGQKVFVDINRSLRLIEIIGQILRNRHGSMRRESLKELTESAYTSGLKLVKFFLEAVENDQEKFIDYIASHISDEDLLSDEAYLKKLQKTFMLVCYGTVFSAIKKIANSLGTPHLMRIYEELADENPDSPAHRLIQIAVHLEFKKEIPRKLVAETFDKLSGNPVAQRLVQELIVQHLLLNHVEVGDRQWIQDNIKIPMTFLRRLQK